MTPLRSLRPVLLCGLLLGLLSGLLSGCALRPLAVRALADELAAQGAAPEEDVLLARDAAPFYLKLSESVLAQTPGHLPLAGGPAGGLPARRPRPLGPPAVSAAEELVEPKKSRR